jgi:hypothetical protein
MGQLVGQRFVRILRIASLAAAMSPEMAFAKESPAEESVRNALNRGAIADLTNEPDERHRILSPDFLESVLHRNVPGQHFHGVRIVGAVFEEPIEIESSHIAYTFWCDRCLFKKKVSFDLDSFDGMVSFESSVFEDEVDLLGIQASYLVLRGSSFKKNVSLIKARLMTLDGRRGTYPAPDDKPASFEGPLLLENAELNGPLNLAEARIETLSLSGAQVSSVDLSKTQVQSLLLEEADIHGSLSLKGGYFAPWKKDPTCRTPSVDANGAECARNIDLTGAEFRCAVQAENVRVGGHILAADTKFHDALDLKAMRVGGIVDLKAVFEVDGQIDLSNGKCQCLQLPVAEKLPATGGKMMILGGVGYERLIVDWRSVFRRVHYQSEDYANLESAFKREGNDTEGDEVFMASKARERETSNPLAKMSSWGRWLLNGYGRESWHALIPSIAIILLGTFLFRKKSMERAEKAEGFKNYRALFYSVVLFIPIDMEIDKVWTPKDDNGGLRVYAKIHRVLGHVLVGLAVYGLLKGGELLGG